MSFLRTPPYAQHIGPRCIEGGWEYREEREIVQKLMEQLPVSVNVDINLSPEIRDFLPFRWAGFRVEPRVTQRITHLEDLDKVFAGIDKRKQSQIRQATRMFRISDKVQIEDLIRIDEDTFRRQGKQSRLRDSALVKQYLSSEKHPGLKLLGLEDGNGKIVATALLRYDARICYSLVVGRSEEGGNLAGNLLTWECIRFAASVSKIFDFEGSVLEGVETYNRRFGAESFVFYKVYRYTGIYKFLNRLGIVPRA